MENDKDYIENLFQKLNLNKGNKINEIDDKQRYKYIVDSMSKQFPCSYSIFNIIVKKSPSPMSYKFEENLIASIFKLFPVDKKELSLYLNDLHTISNNQNNNYFLLAQSKVISTDLKEGDFLYLNDTENKVKVHSIFIQVGKEMIRVENAYIGSIASLFIIPQEQISSETFLYRLPCIAKFHAQSKSVTTFNSTNDLKIPLLRVIVNPSDPTEYMKLKEGMDCMSKCENSIKFWIDEDDGNLVIATNGEINLEKCLKDAKDM
ncbi:MAG: Cytoplasmic GTPase/eEF2-like protein (ribosomal biogenesis) [Paramarteilia canceri]